VQPAATSRTLRDLDPQQDQQPLGGGLRRLLGHPRHAEAQQSPALRQSLAFDAVGQQAVVADAKEAVGQDMLEKAVEKLLGGKFVNLLAVPVPTVPVGVTHLAVLAVEQAMTADRHAMCVAAQVIDQLPRAGKRGSRVDYPTFPPQCVIAHAAFR